jgi:RecA-family ATPase
LSEIHRHCIPGKDAVLGQPDRNGIIRPTALFERLERSAMDIRPALIIIEAAADVFAGNENDRAQVRQFIGLLRRLAIGSGASVLLLAHPSLSGMASGAGTSGSTGWHNSVRSRLYFASPKTKIDDEADPDVRQLQVMKSNYGPAGEVVKLRWQSGVFVPEGGPSTLVQIAVEAKANDAFMRCLDAKTAQGIEVSHKLGRNYAPKIFADMAEAEGFKKRALELAMERLLSAGRIRADDIGPASRRKAVLIRIESAP